MQHAQMICNYIDTWNCTHTTSSSFKLYWGYNCNKLKMKISALHQHIACCQWVYYAKEWFISQDISQMIKLILGMIVLMAFFKAIPKILTFKDLTFCVNYCALSSARARCLEYVNIITYSNWLTSLGVCISAMLTPRMQALVLLSESPFCFWNFCYFNMYFTN